VEIARPGDKRGTALRFSTDNHAGARAEGALARTKKRVRLEDDRGYWRQQTPLTIFSDDANKSLINALPSPITAENRDVLVRVLRLLAHVQISEGMNPTPDSREERRTARTDLTRIETYARQLQEILGVGARVRSRAWWELIHDDPRGLDQADEELDRVVALIARLGDRAHEALGKLPNTNRRGPRRNSGREIAVAVFVQLYEEISGATAGRTSGNYSMQNVSQKGFVPFAHLAFKALFHTTAGLDDLIKTCLEHRRSGRFTVNYVKIVKEDLRAGIYG